MVVGVVRVVLSVAVRAVMDFLRVVVLIFAGVVGVLIGVVEVVVQVVVVVEVMTPITMVVV